jgi:chromosomal replication initiator protein
MTCPKEIKELWEIVKESFKGNMSGAAFDMWYGSLVPSLYDPDFNVLTFDTESEFKCKKLTEQHKQPIERAFLSEAGLSLEVAFRFVGKPAEAEDLIDRIKESSSARVESTVMPGESYQLSKYTFDNFIVGDSNRFARAVCWKVASNAHVEEYNPLFIYGPSGVGKTHLMYAVINEMKRTNPDIKVIYTKGEDFTNNMVSHIAHKTMDSFRALYRGCDVLLVDDIQFIAGRESTQMEVFHTFQSLFDEGKRIILASDRPPKDINPLEERLRSRFEQGLLTDINPPDFELRVAIIKKKAEDLAIDVPIEVLEFLAENLRSNIRQIEGSIKKLAAKSLVDGRPITLKYAQEVLSDLIGESEPLEVTIDKIFSAVVKKYNIPREEIIGKKRTKEIMLARHVSIYLVREITEMSFPNIGKLFGGKDHTTMISSSDWVKKKIIREPIFAADVESLRKEITGN